MRRKTIPGKSLILNPCGNYTKEVLISGKMFKAVEKRVRKTPYGDGAYCMDLNTKQEQRYSTVNSTTDTATSQEARWKYRKISSTIWHLTPLAAKDNGKNAHVGSHTTGSRRQLHMKRAAFKKGTGKGRGAFCAEEMTLQCLLLSFLVRVMGVGVQVAAPV